MRTTGTVKWYDDLRIGVIARDDSDQHCFFYPGAIVGSGPLREGQRVELDVVQAPEGTIATNVVVIRPVSDDGSRPRVEIRDRGPRRLLPTGGKALRFGRL